MRVPVLTYHSNNIAGTDYAGNDHVALAADLRALHAHGLHIVPLIDVVAARLGEADAPSMHDAVAITFDDGTLFDWHDLDHPEHGLQRGFAGILRDYRDETGAAVHATSFVIASPEAREVLDRRCMIGRGWMGDDWWRDAEREGLIAIANHSWDHHHEALADSPEQAHAQGRGTFTSIDTWAAADAQIRRAAEFIDAHLGATSARVFAYPYGDSNAYLRDDYFPHHAAEHRQRAAFGTDPAPVTGQSPIWNLPRYVCGRDWRSPEAFARLLAVARS